MNANSSNRITPVVIHISLGPVMAQPSWSGLDR